MKQELRRVFGHFATGVTIVTARSECAPVGMTANSFSSLSLDPPLMLWSLAKTSLNHAAFLQARHFAIHVLDACQSTLSRQFASRNTDRFAGVKIIDGLNGVPLLTRFHALFECATEFHHDGGDHTIIVGRVLRFAEQPGKPLLFYRGTFTTVNVGSQGAGVNSLPSSEETS
jgi:flavin reductase (DIM6/NTAB) family NADH-FMN oxidoreductase RutF